LDFDPIQFFYLTGMLLGNPPSAVYSPHTSICDVYSWALLSASLLFRQASWLVNASSCSSAQVANGWAPTDMMHGDEGGASVTT
jgi:hypothetical protein